MRSLFNLILVLLPFYCYAQLDTTFCIRNESFARLIVSEDFKTAKVKLLLNNTNQILSPIQNRVNENLSVFFEIRDYNSDGYMDFSFYHVDAGKGTYFEYSVFVYDKKLASFKRLSSPEENHWWFNIRLYKKGKIIQTGNEKNIQLLTISKKNKFKKLSYFKQSYFPLYLKNSTLNDRHFYKIDNWTFEIAYPDSLIKENKRLIVLDSVNKKMQTFLACFADSYACEPLFYSSEKRKMPILLFLREGSEFEYGVHVFLVYKNHVIKAGEIEAATHLDASSPILSTAYIHFTNKNILIEFDYDAIIITNPGLSEKLHRGDEILFLIKNYRNYKKTLIKKVITSNSKI